MSWFRREKTKESAAERDAQPVSEKVTTDALHTPAATVSGHGPYDAAEVDTSDHLDFGSLKVPPQTGIQFRLIGQTAASGSVASRLELRVGSSALHVMVIATPRSGGAWDEIRPQLLADLAAQEAKTREAKGRWGQEIQASVTTTAPNGAKGQIFTRLIGVEGPRWLLRIDLIGPAAVDQEQFKPVAELIDNLVVFRDDVPRPPLTPIPITLPGTLTQTTQPGVLNS